MNNKICIVTGANAGLGRETALALTEMGAQVVMICRNPEKAEEARSDIVKRSGNEKVDVILGDFTSLASVRKAAEAFLARYDRLDVLVNNAGLYKKEYALTPDGFETQFETNHLAPFLLTNLLLDVLKKNAPSRVVTVSSGAHQLGKIDFDNLNGEKRYSGWFQYCNTKLANILFTRELAQRLEGTGVTANCLHPGGVNTNFARADTPKILRNLAGLFMLSPRKGAETSIYLASSPEVMGVTGKYFVKCKPAGMIRRAQDNDIARRLWDVSAKMTGVQA